MTPSAGAVSVASCSAIFALARFAVAAARLASRRRDVLRTRALLEQLQRLPSAVETCGGGVARRLRLVEGRLRRGAARQQQSRPPERQFGELEVGLELRVLRLGLIDLGRPRPGDRLVQRRLKRRDIGLRAA